MTKDQYRVTIGVVGFPEPQIFVCESHGEAVKIRDQVYAAKQLLADGDTTAGTVIDTGDGEHITLYAQYITGVLIRQKT